MSAKVLIFVCRGVCTFTPAKREEKSAFLVFFGAMGVPSVQKELDRFTIDFCLFEAV